QGDRADGGGSGGGAGADGAGEEYGVADEAGDPGVGGVPVEVLRGVALGDAALPDDGDEVRGGEGLLLVVGDQQGRGPGGPQRGPYVGADSGAQGAVEGVEGFVEQDEGGAGGEGPGQGDALLLAAGQFVRHAGAVAGQSDEVEHLLRAAAALGAGGAGQAEGDVAGHAEVGEEGSLLGHDADAPALGRDLGTGAGQGAAADGDGARVGAQEPGDDAQQGGLAAAGGAEQGGQGTGRDGEVHSPQDGGVGAVGLGESLDAEVVGVVGHVRCLPRR